MITKNDYPKITLIVVLFIYLNSVAIAQVQPDYVKGNLIQFNDNGFWCWYQDERVVIDTVQGKLITGSDASAAGTGGATRDGNIEGIIYDLETTQLNMYLFRKTSCDDHNAPSFEIRPDGKYIAMYSDHYDKYNNRYRIFDGNNWSNEKVFDWTTIPGGTDYTIAYNNVYYLSAERRMYDFSRANHRSPNFIYSDDMGETWHFGGQLTTNSSTSYNKGYYKYWSNGVDRIDFIFTEQHPRDTSTSIYHGYIKDHKSYKSDGTLVDSDIYNVSNLPTFKQFTKVFADNTIINGNAIRRCWNVDVEGYNNGIIATIITARINNNEGGYISSVDPDHAFIYCRYNGSGWSYTYLCQAGKKMYDLEQDYTGLGALVPGDPNTIYISTNIDPRDNANILKRELFKGVTTDNGQSWTWTPVTWKSTVDNFRPVVPKWNAQDLALLWCRGSYTAAQSFNTAVVGLIEDGKTPGLMTYVDADISNTTNRTGASLVYSGPDENDGANDGLWHARTNGGNNNTVFTSSEIGGENAEMMRTTVTVPSIGKYDVWVNFWASPSADWRIKAGLNESNLQLFRQMACKRVDDGAHTSQLTLSKENVYQYSTEYYYLYQAYLGKVNVVSGNSFNIYIDDESIVTGSTSDRAGNTARTWYDGISFECTQNAFISKSFIVLKNIDNATDSFEVVSDTNWDLSCSAGWLTLSETSGNGSGRIKLVASKNATNAQRFTTITFTVNGQPIQTINVTQNDINTGVDRVSNNTISVYPIPTKEFVTIDFKNITKSVIQIYSMNGQLKESIHCEGVQQRINLSGYQHGLYIIKIIIDNKVYTYKILKE